MSTVKSIGRLRPSNNRSKPLVAVNLLGSGKGGAAKDRLTLCEALVPALQEAAAKEDTDVVLVTSGAEAYSAAQRAREKHIDQNDPAVGLQKLWELGPASSRLIRVAGDLAEQARLGKLVLFIGAGVSASAGVPQWRALLTGLAERAKLGAEERCLLEKMDFRDQAAILQRRFGSPEILDGEVKALVGASRYSLAHALLASLRTQEAVTTNYDTLYEQASSSAGRPLTIISGDRVGRGAPWLLKLHGSIEEGAEIVLTRQHYEQLAEQRGALLGLLQAMLLTRHLLFVGYSLSDDDFYSVMSDVRRILRGGGQVGTVLTLFQNPLLNELWAPELEVIPVSDRGEDQAHLGTADAARTLQIVLDLVGFMAADMTSFLLAEGYEADILSDDERNLRTALLAMQDQLPQGAVPSSLGRVRDLLASFGAKGITDKGFTRRPAERAHRAAAEKIDERLRPSGGQARKVDP